MGDYQTAVSGGDSTLTKAKEMDAQQKIQDVAKKLCLKDERLWQPTIDPNKPGGLTDEEKKQLTLEQEECKLNQEDYTKYVEDLYYKLSSVDYTITTK